ncbi:MAG: tetratricopeptide repeat protein [Acidiferrobacterales bacterium]
MENVKDRLGCALLFQGKQPKAEQIFRQALALRSDHAPTHMQLGHLSTGLTAALAHYRRAVKLEPSFAEAHAAIGAVLVSCGQINEGVSSLRRALRLNPALHCMHSDLLFSLNYDPACEHGAIFSEHVRYFETRAINSGFKLEVACGAFTFHHRAANFDYPDETNREKKLNARWARVHENCARFKLKYGLPVEPLYTSTNDVDWNAISSSNVGSLLRLAITENSKSGQPDLLR